MNTLENNKLIAEFMGIENYKFRHYTMFAFEEDNHRTAQDLHCHQSWDWLMPVVEKCFEYSEVDNHYRNQIIASMAGVIDIEDTYEAVVKFIKWYNENNL